MGFICFAVPVLFIACGSGQKTETGRTVAGFAVHGHEVRSFRPCGADQALWAVDRSGTLWKIYEEREFHNELYEEVFCIVEGTAGPAPQGGFGADYPGAIEISKVLYMAQEGFRCNVDLSEFHYRAFGNEPFWSVSISADKIVMKTPGGEDRVWTDIVQQRTDDQVVYMADGPAGPVEIRITEEPCRDSMSGAYYGFSAVARAGDTQFRGCVLRGTGSPPR
jgi:putative lipoprotein